MRGEAVKALLPPAEQKRGLVLIDPPYEDPDRSSRISRQKLWRSQPRIILVFAVAFWPHGIRPNASRAAFGAFFNSLSAA